MLLTIFIQPTGPFALPLLLESWVESWASATQTKWPIGLGVALLLLLAYAVYKLAARLARVRKEIQQVKEQTRLTQQKTAALPASTFLTGKHKAV